MGWVRVLLLLDSIGCTALNASVLALEGGLGGDALAGSITAGRTSSMSCASAPSWRCSAGSLGACIATQSGSRKRSRRDEKPRCPRPHPQTPCQAPTPLDPCALAL